ncbi:sugar ABC transporter ATP-binding protein [Streptomyces cacaoi]|uniref:sugar ABC transporter ATP-binding protein n=1 Tax=Streptomyces cacaoi TaxID=1898 RepID=UPI0011F34078|nr:sugar ABC transporter ATP-binding protein [Streptomyces cacaoi]
MTAADGPGDGARPGAPAAVHAEGIVKRYGPTLALDGVGLTVRPGEAHALVGRNGAGKSTLVSVLTGMQRPDSGTVRFHGEPAPAFGDTAAWRSRVACVYQRSMVVPELTVAENLFLNRFPGGPRIRWKALRARAGALLEGYGVAVDPAARTKELTVEQRQFVEIARALSFGARTVILDEPTAQLDAAGIERLFGKLRELRDQGVAFLFISHHLQEVYELCDTVTVYRDARQVLTAPVAGLPRRELVAAMTADTDAAPARTAERTRTADAAHASDETRTADAAHASDGTRTADAVRPVPGEAVLCTEQLALEGGFAPVDLRVRAGEVLGLAGATASGNTALGETLAGLRRQTAGTVRVRGRTVRPGSVPHALDAGIGYVPEDRHAQGLVPHRSVAENATLTVADQLGPWGTVLPSRTRRFARRMIESLDIKTPGPEQPVSGLSGGNQQKVVVARALARDPAVLVAVRPTAGVDVKSKDALLGVVRDVADRGSAAVIVSDELDDLRVCDRVLALFHGRVVAEYPAGWSDRELVAAMEGMTARRGHGPADDGPADEGPADDGRAPDGTGAADDGSGGDAGTDATEGNAP